jgi:hypothetical protein
MSSAEPADADRRAPGDSGHSIVLADAVGTAAFVITASIAAIVFSTASQWVGAITAMSLFTVGVFVFLWSFWTVVQRSRIEQIAVTQVYLLVGAPTPPGIRRRMLALLAIQCVTALITALARTEQEDGSPGTSLAVGVLVPMFGLALNGLWAGQHGVFPSRDDLENLDGASSVALIDKNDDHG